MTRLKISREFLTILASVISTLPAIGQILPMDGQSLTVYMLDQSIEQYMGAAEMVDLSNAVIEDRVEMRFDYYGDSIVSRTSGLRKDWFQIKGDTVWSVGSNTRQEMRRYHRGMPYLILSAADSCFSTDSLRHVSFLTFDRQNMESAAYSTSEGCGFIFNTCDTVATTYCVHTVTADTLYRVDNRRWYADHCVWPVVEEISISRGDETYLTALYVCPPSEQPQPPSFAKRNNTANTWVYNIIDSYTDRTLNPNVENRLNQYKITSTPTSILVKANDHEGAQGTPSNMTYVDRDLGNCTMRLYDASGRQWYESTGTSEIPTSQLYPGTYILEITKGSSTSTYKIQIKE